MISNPANQVWKIRSMTLPLGSTSRSLDCKPVACQVWSSKSNNSINILSIPSIQSISSFDYFHTVATQLIVLKFLLLASGKEFCSATQSKVLFSSSLIRSFFLESNLPVNRCNPRLSTIGTLYPQNICFMPANSCSNLKFFILECSSKHLLLLSCRKSELFSRIVYLSMSKVGSS